MSNINKNENQEESLRQLFFDTETTGQKTTAGHRIIELAMIEVVNGEKTGETKHFYFNPEREVEEKAFEVHGLDSNFLKDKPRFKDVLPEIIEFMTGAELVAHNASFDMGFLEYEFNKAGSHKSVWEVCSGSLDTLNFARKAYPGKKNSLDALCDRLSVDRSDRTYHGALLDSEILFSVYVKMKEQNPHIDLKNDIFEKDIERDPVVKLESKPALRTISASSQDISLHDNFFEVEAEKKMKAKI